MQEAAFFDLDKTLIARSTVLAFAGPLREADLLTRRDVRRSALAQLRFASDRADHALMERMRVALSAIITGWSTETLRSVIETHLESILLPLVYDEALALIEEHRRAGRRLILVTSTGHEMADPIGGFFGVDHVLATAMVHDQGRYTGAIADYMYGPRKAAAITELADAEGLDLSASYAYSDSVTDLPLLEVVARPTAVNPDRALRRVALERGWPVLLFRHAEVLRRDRDDAVARAATSVLIAVATGLVVAVLRTLAKRRRRTRDEVSNKATVG